MATHARGLKSSHRLAATISLMIGFVCLVAVGADARDPFAEYDLVMYERPSLPRPHGSAVFPDGLKELWFQALERPDAELQRLVIDTLAIGHRRGVDGLGEAKPRLLELIEVPNQRLDVLRAIAQTLVAMDAREQADVLSELSSNHGLSIAGIVEPALVRWKSPAIGETWLERVSNADSGPTMMTFAIQGLGELATAEASEPLQKILFNNAESIGLRMSAARALGKIHSSGQVDVARRIIEVPSRAPNLNQLFAIEILDQHDDPKTVELLTELVANESTTIQAAALERLFRIDINLVDRHADALITSKDANVRRWCARALIAKKDAERIGLLCTVLDDVNPGLRREVSGALVELAEVPALREEVLDRTNDVLNRNDWRGCEQACVVLAKLDYEPSGRRMVELLGHERGEVKVASAWGLTQLRVEELLPDMLDHAQSVYDGWGSKQLNDGVAGASLHLAHLFIAFGDQRYREADSLMRRYLPKKFSLGFHSRPAAAWALGMLYEDEPQDDLIPIMVERMTDTSSPEPETDAMQQMCAISLGRMKAESALDDLRKHAVSNPACLWAIERITGEVFPQREGATRVISGWFLAPIQ